MNYLLEKFKNLELYWKISLLLIIILPWILIFQSFSWIDEWFLFTNYYYFFSHPDKINFSFIWYLTDLIWWTFNYITWIWFISSRLLRILTLYSIFYLIYIIFKGILKINHILLWLLLSFLFLNTVFIYNWFDYNHLTSFIYLVTFIFLTKWLFNNNILYIFLFWLFLGINFFSKITNIVWLLIIFLIPIYHLLEWKFCKNKLKHIFWQIFFAILWVLSGIIFILWIIIFLWHFSLYIESIKEALLLWKDSELHSIKVLIFRYLKNYVFIWLITWWVISFVYLITKYIKNKIILISIFLIIWFILGFISIFKLKYSFNILWLNIFISYHSYIFPWLWIFLLFYMLFFNKKIDYKIKFLYILSIFFIFIVSLWSDVYIEQMRFWFYLFFPLLVYLLFESRWFIKKIILYLIITLAWWGLIYLYWNSYFDNINKLELVHSFKSEKLIFIYSSDETVKKINILTEVLKPFKNKEILSIWYLNYIYVISNMLPYTNSSWLEYLSFVSFKDQVKRKLNKWLFPEIILIKKNLFINTDKSKDFELFINEKIIKKYKYWLYFENDDFLIYNR